MRERVMGAALLVLVLLALTSCAAHQPAGVATSAEGVAPTIPKPSVPPIETAQKQLARLHVAPRVRPAGYYRALFGTPWQDADGDGCNQRDDVLLRDAVPGSVRVGTQDTCRHHVLAGSWIDPYTGTELTFDDLKDPHQSIAVQVDQVVPLAEAWVSGASHWPRSLREQFANDLDELQAVDGPTEKVKGDGDPAAWHPGKAYQCDYARRWIWVKSQWHLAVDPSEHKELEKMLGQC